MKNDAVPLPKRIGVSHRLLITLVIAMTLAAYVGTLGYQFVYDDRGQIVDNRLIKSWHYIPRYFTSHSWNHLYPNLLGNYYRPVFLIWSLINHTLFGLNPFWWHLTAVALHVLATMFVYLLARRLLKDQLAAIIAAMIFGLHPVHIEAVAWISGATESLFVILLIPAFLCYINWREARKHWKWIAASLALYCTAMFAKETALVLPMLIFAYEWINGFRRSGLREQFNQASLALVRAAPYVALTGGYLFIRSMALS